MRNSNRILTILFIIFAFGCVLTFKYLLEGLFLAGEFYFSFSALSYLGAFFLLGTIVVATIFYVKFLKLQNFASSLFFVLLPINLMLMFIVFSVVFLSSTQQQGSLELVKLALGIQSSNSENTYLIMAVVACIYLGISFLVYFSMSKPVRNVEKITRRLGDGIVNGQIEVGKSKQFKNIEHSLVKINENYKRDAKVLKDTNEEVEKFVPKQFLKFFGAKNILDLQLGNSVQKEVTTLFCDINNSFKISASLSLEENFHFINAYLNLISPLIRRYNGFVDKYLGDGIMAVFLKPEHAFECTRAIFSAVEDLNFKSKDKPTMRANITIHTGEVVFGVLGEENRKSLTILSEGVSFASKLRDVNKFFQTKAVFSKRTLNSLPYGYGINYRYIGSFKNEESGADFYSVFELLDLYKRVKREKILKHKNAFEEASRLYSDGDFERAKKLFEVVVKQNEEDQVAQVYLKTCDEKLKLEE